MSARLGELLVSSGVITQDQLQIALREQRSSGERLGEIIVRLGFASHDAITKHLATARGVEWIDLKGIIPIPQALALLPKHIAIRANAFPVAYDEEDNILLIAISDIYDVVAIDLIRRHLAGKVLTEFRLASKDEISEAINRSYGHELNIDNILHELETGSIDLVTLTSSLEDYKHPVVRLADLLLADAVLNDASDIHFEPEAHQLRIRYRIDGVLHTIRLLHLNFWPPLCTRLKIMSGMDIAEMRAPQDGRITLPVAGRLIDFRCSTQPTIHGENFVLRVLDKKRAIISLDALGLESSQLSLLKLMLQRPEGLLLVTGPTGSGKTTTLYAMLNHLNHDGVNIMTLEDPVEYAIGLVRQTQIGQASKIDFSSGIRSLLRQDPDIIMLGEIRDPDSAAMAFRAAMTGHMVLSTLHTNSALRALPRLTNLGLSHDIMAGNIIGILGQRLVRKLCRCAKPRPANREEQALFRLIKRDVDVVYEPSGCPLCKNTGYKGRTVVMEIVFCTQEIDDMILSGAKITEIEREAEKHGFTPMAYSGLKLVADGTTTLDELKRVVNLTELQQKVASA